MQAHHHHRDRCGEGEARARGLRREARGRRSGRSKTGKIMEHRGHEGGVGHVVERPRAQLAAVQAQPVQQGGVGHGRQAYPEPPRADGPSALTFEPGPSAPRRVPRAPRPRGQRPTRAGGVPRGGGLSAAARRYPRPSAVRGTIPVIPRRFRRMKAGARRAGPGTSPRRRRSPQQQDFSAVEVKAEKVAEGVYMLSGSRAATSGSRSARTGFLIVDDQYAPLAPKIEAALRGIAEAPVRFVLNTHWHGDHTGGNEGMGKAGSASRRARERAASGMSDGAVHGGRSAGRYPPRRRARSRW